MFFLTPTVGVVWCVMACVAPARSRRVIRERRFNMARSRLPKAARMWKREWFKARRNFVQAVVEANELAPKPERDILSRNERDSYKMTHTKGFRDPQRKLLATPKELVVK